MRKNFLSKGVAVLGAILLLANVTFPGLVAYAQEAPEDPVLVYDLIYDEASWNAAYYKENSALKAYLDDNRSEDRWSLTYDRPCNWNDRNHPQDWNNTTGFDPESQCVPNWSGAIEAPGAKYPWAVINVPAEGLTGTIVFEYGNTYVDDTAKAPFGKHIMLKNKYGIVSIPATFGDDSLLVGNDGFDPDVIAENLKIEIIPEELSIIDEGEQGDGWRWFYVHDETTWNAAYADGMPLKSYYERSDTVGSFPYKDALWHTTDNHACNWLDINPIESDEKTLYPDGYHYVGCERNFTGAIKQGGAKFPWIVVGFDEPNQNVVAVKYTDNGDSDNPISISIETPYLVETPKNYRVIDVPTYFGDGYLENSDTYETTFNKAGDKLSVRLVVSESPSEPIIKATYPTYTVSFETDGGSAVESQSVELGKKATKPDTDPTKDGFGFVSWQTCTGDETLVCTDFDFDSPIVENTTLVANWGSTAWELSSIHALPAVLKGETDTPVSNVKADEKVGTFQSADGSYTVAIEGNTITYKNISLKDPGEEDNENGHRPSGYIWMGARFYHPVVITDNAKFNGKDLTETNKTNKYNDVWFGVSAEEIENSVNSGVYTKELSLTASWNGEEQQSYKIVVDLHDIAIVYKENEVTTEVIEVVDGKITKLDGETAYTITFDTDGGSAVASISANSGDAITAPANPTKDGYTFNGWDKEIPTVMPAEDLTIKATWKSNSSGGSSSGGGGSSKSSTKATDNKGSVNNATGTNESLTGDNNNTLDNNNEEDNTPMTLGEAIALFGDEQIDAYQWALENGITTMDTVEKARLDQPLTRAELAKMMVVYIQKVLKADPVVTGEVKYLDVDESLGDLAGYIQLAYQYQIMGINADGTSLENFNPNGVVTRGEYATVFSRVLFGSVFNKEGADFYTNHLEALKEAGILKDTTPTMQEIRGWVMLMMYRSSQNTEKIEEVAAAAEKASVAPAEQAVVAPVEGTSVEPAEEASAASAEQAAAAPAEEGSAAPEASN